MGPAFQRLEASYRYLDPSPVSFRLLGWCPLPFITWSHGGALPPTQNNCGHIASLRDGLADGAPGASSDGTRIWMALRVGAGMVSSRI
jgi:hypothetical protein